MAAEDKTEKITVTAGLASSTPPVVLAVPAAVVTGGHTPKPDWRSALAALAQSAETFAATSHYGHDNAACPDCYAFRQIIDEAKNLLAENDK